MHHTATVKDPTVFHWAFFLRWRGREAEEDESGYRATIEEALDRAAKWVGSDAHRDWTWASDRSTSVRMHATGWVETCQGDLRSLEARTLLDAVYVETTVALVGQKAVDTFSNLRHRMCSYGEGGPLLGQAWCLWMEVNGGVDEDRARDLGKAAAEACGLSPVIEKEHVISMPWGYWIIPRGRSEAGETWILIVGPGDDAVRRASELAHRLAPSMFLARLKWLRLHKQHEEKLWRDARRLEAKLDQQLPHLAEHPEQLEALEGAVEAVARLQGEYAELLSQIEEGLETLRVNAGNLERVLNDPMFAPARTRLDDLLVAPLRLASEQMATDLRYLSVTRDQADRMMESLQTIAEVRSGRWERRTTFWLGIFAVAGTLFTLVEVFPELLQIPLTWRVPGLGVISVLLLLLLRWRFMK